MAEWRVNRMEVADRPPGDLEPLAGGHKRTGGEYVNQ
jgi:hypothetical protein